MIYAQTTIYSFLELEEAVKLQRLNRRHYRLIIPKMLIRARFNVELGLIEKVTREALSKIIKFVTSYERIVCFEVSMGRILVSLETYHKNLKLIKDDFSKAGKEFSFKEIDL